MLVTRRYLTDYVAPLAPVNHRGWSPAFGAADLYETDDAVVVHMTAPGFKAEDISVQEQQGLLMIRADRRAHRRGERDGLQFEAERVDFVERRFRLPSEVDADHAAATLSDGVLTIRLPKAQTSRAQRVVIQPTKRPAAAERPRRTWLERLTSWWHRSHAGLTHRAA